MPQLSLGTEAKLNGEGRLKAVPGPAASVFNHRSPPHLRLHADQAAVKGAMHPATPIHKCTEYALVPSRLSDFCLSKAIRLTTASSLTLFLAAQHLISTPQSPCSFCTNVSLVNVAPSLHLRFHNKPQLEMDLRSSGRGVLLAARGQIYS